MAFEPPEPTEPPPTITPDDPAFPAALRRKDDLLKLYGEIFDYLTFLSRLPTEEADSEVKARLAYYNVISAVMRFPPSIDRDWARKEMHEAVDSSLYRLNEINKRDKARNALIIDMADAAANELQEWLDYNGDDQTIKAYVEDFWRLKMEMSGGLPAAGGR